MCDKAVKRVKCNLIEQVKKIQKPKDIKEEWKAINQYNLMVIGFHNYYKTATNINLDMRKIARNVNIVMENRLKRRIKRTGNLEKYIYIKKKYGKSKQMRFINKMPIIPLGYVQTRLPLWQRAKVNG